MASNQTAAQPARTDDLRGLHRSASFHSRRVATECAASLLETQAEQCRQNGTKWRDESFAGMSSLFIHGEQPPADWQHRGKEIKFMRPEEFTDSPSLQVVLADTRMR